MATRDEISEHFIRPLSAVFGDPQRDGRDLEEFFAALMVDLEEFSLAAIKAACINIRRTSKWFPTISECIRECRQAIVAPPSTEKERPRWSKAEALAFLRQHPEAAQWAYDRGCLCGLDLFVQLNHRMPDRAEARKMIPPRPVAVIVADLEARPFQGSAQLLGIGRQMIERAEHLAELLHLRRYDPITGEAA